MKTNNISSEKKAYNAPMVETIYIDNEISLQLSSAFNALPGDPNDNCVTDNEPENLSDSPWE